MSDSAGDMEVERREIAITKQWRSYRGPPLTAIRVAARQAIAPFLNARRSARAEKSRLNTSTRINTPPQITSR